jgi:hypothetical protein
MKWLEGTDEETRQKKIKLAFSVVISGLIGFILAKSLLERNLLLGLFGIACIVLMFIFLFYEEESTSSDDEPGEKLFLDKKIREGDIEGALKGITEKSFFLHSLSVKTIKDVNKMLMLQKRDTTYLIYIGITLHIIGGIGMLFGWMFLWDIITRFWSGLGRISYNVFNEPIYFLGVPIVFPFSGTIGLLFGSWLLYIGWSLLPRLGIKLDELTDIHYLKNHEGLIIGRFWGKGVFLTGSRMVDDVMMITCTPSEKLNGNEVRLRRLWKNLRCWWPFYIDVEQIHVDKYIVIAPNDGIEPKENFANHDNQLKSELIDSGYFITSGPTIYKVFLSGFS